MSMTESEKQFYLEGDNGLRPYLRSDGMPKDKVNQIAWLLLNGSGCGFCKVCRDEPCNIKDGEKCTTNIANYIREIVLEESESEYRAIGTVSEFRQLKEKAIAKKPIYSDFDENEDEEIIPYKAVCPACGHEFEFGTWNDEENHHCECGQRMLWE